MIVFEPFRTVIIELLRRLVGVAETVGATWNGYFRDADVPFLNSSTSLHALIIPLSRIIYLPSGCAYLLAASCRVGLSPTMNNKIKSNELFFASVALAIY